MPGHWIFVAWAFGTAFLCLGMVTVLCIRGYVKSKKQLSVLER